MKFITIDSKLDITVTNGLLNVDKTNYSSKVGNNLNVAPLWTRTAIHIKKGKHLYPAEIVEWNSVKVLEANDTFTIGREVDEGSQEEEAALKEFLDNKQQAEIEAAIKRKRKKTDETAE